jgi:FkbM family methyltransferase
VAPKPFVSYAQNREDVVLARALKHVESGRYVDIGANDPVADSVSYAFYDRGWSGITVEPVPMYADRLRQLRPRDQVVQAAITGHGDGTITLHQIADTGLSTLVDDVSAEHRGAGWEVEDITVETRRLDTLLEEAGWEGHDIHFVVIDTEGAERDVLETVDLHRWRPWVLVIEATRPNGTEPTQEAWEHLVLGAGYRFCLFDGLSRFYVAEEKADKLAPLIQAPANILDNYVTHRQLVLSAELEAVRADMLRHDELNQSAILEWRSAAVQAWVHAADGALTPEREEELLQQIHLHVNHIQVVDEQLEAMRRTLSWRVTRPLRGLRSLSSAAKRDAS